MDNKKYRFKILKTKQMRIRIQGKNERGSGSKANGSKCIVTMVEEDTF